MLKRQATQNINKCNEDTLLYQPSSGATYALMEYEEHMSDSVKPGYSLKKVANINRIPNIATALTTILVRGTGGGPQSHNSFPFSYPAYGLSLATKFAVGTT